MTKKIEIAVILVIIGGLLFLSKIHFKNFSFWSGFERLSVLSEEARQGETETGTLHARGAINVPIFVYHSVRPHISWESKWQDAYDVTPELLEQQLVYLKDNGYTAITLDDLAHDMEIGTTSPVAKPVILTFDDGWENQYKYAFPLLKKYHAAAAFYIFTNPISRKPQFLTWEHIKEMEAAGMTIAAHTITHPYLEKLSEERLRIEIFKSKQILEEHLGHSVPHFASPFGFSDAHIEALLKEAGYKTGRTLYKGIYQDDPLRLRGILVSDSFDKFVETLKQQ